MVHAIEKPDAPFIFFADELTSDDELGGYSRLYLVDPGKHPSIRDGIWIDFRKELSWGEESELNGAMIRGVEREQLVRASEVTDEKERMTTLIDVRHQRLLRAAVYIYAWNIPQRRDGTVRALPNEIQQRMAILSKLRPEWGDMINKHIDKIRKEDEELAESQGMSQVREEFGEQKPADIVPVGNASPASYIEVGSPVIDTAN